jgi:hypothetical protein
MKTNTLTLLTIVSLSAADFGVDRPTGPVGLCDFTIDCDEDRQCGPGLLCADRHKQQLKAAGYDTRTANCGPGATMSTWEVCFPSDLLYSAGGSGGMFKYL